MKTIAVKIDDELHKQLKIHAAIQGVAMADIVEKLIKQELETKKEQTR